MRDGVLSRVQTFCLTLTLRQTATHPEVSPASHSSDQNDRQALSMESLFFERFEAVIMFRIGEFAQIAQVSSRQLRFYDQLGLLQPGHINDQTGYRYYNIRQLPRLNSILALKELGLSLEQIGPLLKDEISPSELRGMLTMKRAQVERMLREEEVRLRHIESRIAQIDKCGGVDGYDVVTKSVATIPFLSLRYSCSGMDEAVRMVRTVAEDGAKQIRPRIRDKLIVISRNELEKIGRASCRERV